MKNFIIMLFLILVNLGCASTFTSGGKEIATLSKTEHALVELCMIGTTCGAKLGIDIIIPDGYIKKPYPLLPVLTCKLHRDIYYSEDSKKLRELLSTLDFHKFCKKRPNN